MNMQSRYNAGFYDGVRNWFPKYRDSGTYMEGFWEGKWVQSERAMRDNRFLDAGLDPDMEIDLSKYDLYISIFGGP